MVILKSAIKQQKKQTRSSSHHRHVTRCSEEDTRHTFWAYNIFLLARWLLALTCWLAQRHAAQRVQFVHVAFSRILYHRCYTYIFLNASRPMCTPSIYSMCILYAIVQRLCARARQDTIKCAENSTHPAPQSRERTTTTHAIIVHCARAEGRQAHDDALYKRHTHSHTRGHDDIKCLFGDVVVLQKMRVYMYHIL